MTIVITACTSRKRKPIPDTLRVSALSRAPMTNLSKDWARRLGAGADVFPASDLYGGRSFQEAKLAADLLNARLMVVSAGLGLISADARVPPYACTVLVGTPDSIAAKVMGTFSVVGWWKALGADSPYAQSLQKVATENDGFIYAALSDAYIELISDDLCALPAMVLARLRLFTRAPIERIAPALRQFVMPYDDRLDGPDSLVRGTRGDFAGRALRHFAEFVVEDADVRSAAEHGAVVSAALADWRMAVRFDRQRLDDASLLDLIRDHWDAERGSTSRLLRRFRDDLGIACEQGRFADLARRVRGERT